MKGPKPATEKLHLDHFISTLALLLPSHLCATAQHWTQKYAIYNTLACLEVNQGFFCLKDWLNCSPPAQENSLSQILMSKEKVGYVFRVEEGWSCNSGAEGQK